MAAKTGSRRARLVRAPGPIYVDASALARLYLPEAESEALERQVLGRTDLLASDLAVTEVVSAVARRVRDGQLREPQALRVYEALLDDLASGVFLRQDLDSQAHRAAERLLLQRPGPGLRAADALHLALALGAGTRTLLTYDDRLAVAAAASGLHVLAVR